MNLTAHFTLEEMTRSEVAVRKGLDNTPSLELVPIITQTAQGLERIRSLVGKPLHVNSGYRSPKVNSAVGSYPGSQHTKGEAADIICPGLTPKELAEIIVSERVNLGVDQVILEFGQWVHVSFTENPRHAVLTIDSEGTRQGIA